MWSEDGTTDSGEYTFQRDRFVVGLGAPKSVLERKSARKLVLFVASGNFDHRLVVK